MDGYRHAHGETEQCALPLSRTAPGYLRVKRMARVRPPPQLLGPHPFTLH